MAIAGDLGVELALDAAGDATVALFSETPSRFLVAVAPAQAAAFVAAMGGVAVAQIGVATAARQLLVRSNGRELLRHDLETLRTAWQSGLDGIEL
jgi:phosphoribosylformylglycinamidine synthase subunit PurSL